MQSEVLEWGAPVEGFVHKECGNAVSVRFVTSGDVDVVSAYGKWSCEPCGLHVMESNPGGDNSELKRSVL